MGFLADHWASEGARKKKAKKSGGQLAFVFDDGDAGIMEEHTGDQEKEYPFYGISVSYSAEDEVHTACIMAGEALTSAEIVAELRKLV